MSKSITMTAEQTAIYDEDGSEARELMDELNEQAKALANETGKTVEIYTADGIVANTRDPD